MVIAFSKIYTACHTDENETKPGITLNTADKRVAAPSTAEFLGTQYSVFDVGITLRRMVQQYPLSLVKLSFFFTQVKSNTGIIC